ncbi:terminase small subunit [Bradyrhizobium sp. S3.2.12]|uniref:terminase small subunit n=1 Tax=Bradyrhizobium sp. S3.2.12 TaxID=3156387 RepID=UPI0033981EB5
MSKIDLARAFGFSDTHVDQLYDAGAPFVERGGPGRPWKIESAAFIPWYIKRKQDAATNDFGRVKTREMTARAKQRELKVADLEGQLIPTVEVVAYLADANSTIRARFAAIESQVPGLSDEQREQLRSAIADSIEGLSGDKPEDWKSAPTDGEDDEMDFG